MQGRVFGVSPPAENVQGSVRSNEGLKPILFSHCNAGLKAGSSAKTFNPD